MPYSSKEKMSAHKKKYYQENKEILKVKLYKYKDKVLQTLQGRFKQVKASAQQSKRSFVFTEIDYEMFFYKKSCLYCGRESTGIDRVDSSKDYLMDNCVPCCGDCNEMKSNRTFEEFVDHINRMYRHLSGN